MLMSFSSTRSSVGVPFLASCAACLRRCAPGPVSLRCAPEGGAASSGLGSAGLPSVGLASDSGLGGSGFAAPPRRRLWAGVRRAVWAGRSEPRFSLRRLRAHRFPRPRRRRWFRGQGAPWRRAAFRWVFLRWDVAYRVWSVFVIACQISLAPRPVAAENGSGSAPSWRMLRKPCSCSD